jgi:hypothetical protein
MSVLRIADYPPLSASAVAADRLEKKVSISSFVTIRHDNTCAAPGHAISTGRFIPMALDLHQPKWARRPNRSAAESLRPVASSSLSARPTLNAGMFAYTLS